MIIDIISFDSEFILKLNLSKAYPNINEFWDLESICKIIEKDYLLFFKDYLYLPVEADTIIVPCNLEISEIDIINKLRKSLLPGFFYLTKKEPIISNECAMFKIMKLNKEDYMSLLKIVKGLKLKAFL